LQKICAIFDGFAGFEYGLLQEYSNEQGGKKTENCGLKFRNCGQYGQV